MEHLAEEEIRPDIRLDGTEIIETFGGEAWCEDYQLTEYGVNFEKISINNITPAQMVQLACVVVDHLLLCGHKFKIVPTNEQDQREQLIHYSKYD